MPRLIDLTGERFGRLVVLARAEKNNWGDACWLCQCDCGNKIIIVGSSLRRGLTKSCGCLNKEIITKHGCHNNLTYKSWQSMKDRCTNPNNKNYKDYSGRGIKVCKRWQDSFTNFLEDMGERPLGYTLERRNNNKGYYKENCEWVTIQKQQRNKRNTLYVPYNGKNRLFVELCEEHNMPYDIVYRRYYKYEWSLEEALTTPVKKYKKRSK